jgi:NTE family protein
MRTTCLTRFLFYLSALIFLSCFALSGCLRKSPPPASLPEKPLPSVKEEREPVIALVLGGGAARGFAHIGVIRVLEQEKIPIRMIVGTSIRSLIGAMYADGQTSFDLEWITHDVKKEDFFDFTFFDSLKGPFIGDKIEEFITKNVKARNIEELKIPYAAVAADLYTGERVILRSGPVAKAVRASCAIPGIFHPVPLGNMLLTDGGIVDNVPVKVARDLGADIVIAVDISRSIEKFEINNLVSTTIQAVGIMAREIGRCRAEGADILIAPEVGRFDAMDFEKKKECIIAGIEAAQGSVDSISELLERWEKALSLP